MVSKSLKTPSLNLKFLCSYGGKILPRYPDGQLRYHGGHTRVLAVDRSISFSELLMKMRELCGSSVSLRCQLPMEDLDALVSVTCDEDLSNLIEEYDRADSPSQSVKIRAFLLIPKTASPPPSNASTSPKSPSNLPVAGKGYFNSRFSTVGSADRCTRYTPTPVKYPCFATNGNPSRIHLIHNGNHWQ